MTAHAKSAASSFRLAQMFLVCALAAIVVGCASPPVKYYAIDPGPPPQPAAAPAAQFPLTLLVARVGSSHLYRDDRLVYGSGPVELGTYEYQRWSESPVDMIQDALVTSLRATRQYRSVSASGSNVRGDYILRGHLYALDEIDKPQLAARFSLELDLFDPATGATVWTGSYSHDEPVGGKTVADVVEALDRNVHSGLQQLTASLGQYFAARPPKSSPPH
jgi:ABC-type uncharacterized transport system auxiliary subunit